MAVCAISVFLRLCTFRTLRIRCVLRNLFVCCPTYMQKSLSYMCKARIYLYACEVHVRPPTFCLTLLSLPSHRLYPRRAPTLPMRTHSDAVLWIQPPSRTVRHPVELRANGRPTTVRKTRRFMANGATMHFVNYFLSYVPPPRLRFCTPFIKLKALYLTYFFFFFMVCITTFLHLV